MAIVFGLWVECRDASERVAVADHFNGAQQQLLTGKLVTWNAHADDPQGIFVGSTALSRSGVRTLDDSIETTEVGLRLYAHLREGPPFQYARVGWVPETIPRDELPGYVTKLVRGCTLPLECVLHDDLYRTLGLPRFWSRFGADYWWLPYKGERYQPLWSNDQESLNGLCRSLFPSYFEINED